MSIFFQSSYSFPVILIHLILIIFVILPESFSNLFMISCKCCSITKAFIIIFLWIYFCSFTFHSIRRIYLWPTEFKICSMAFHIWFCSNTIKYQITTFNWCFQPNMISMKKRLKEYFYKFIFFIINRDFYVITFWMHHALFFTDFRRNKLSCYC